MWFTLCPSCLTPALFWELPSISHNIITLLFYLKHLKMSMFIFNLLFLDCYFAWGWELAPVDFYCLQQRNPATTKLLMERTHISYSHPPKTTWSGSLHSWYIKNILLKHNKDPFSLFQLILPAIIIALYFKLSHSSLLNHPNCRRVQKSESLLLCYWYTLIIFFVLPPGPHFGCHDICNIKVIIVPN